MGISSSVLAIVAAVFGVLAALAAVAGVFRANAEAGASVAKVETEAAGKIGAATKAAELAIAAVKNDAEIEIAEARRQAALANERAAGLEQQNTEVRLQLTKLEADVGARKLSTAQRASIIKALRGKADASFVAFGVPGDPESTHYAAQIAEALTAAGMKIRYGPAPALAIDMAASPGNPLTMYMPLSSDAAGLNLKDPVYAALQRILGPIGASTDVVENRLPTRPTYYYIQVGRRSAPYLNKL